MSRNKVPPRTMRLLTACSVSIWLITLLPSAGTSPATAEETEPPVFVAWPEKGLGLSIELTGFTKEIDHVKPDGRRYLLASHPQTGLTLTITLEKVPSKATAKGCIDQLHRLQKNPFALQGQHLKLNPAGMPPTLEYLLPEFQGTRVDQKNVFACLAQDNVYADIHLSKMQYSSADEPLFQAILKTARLQPQPPPPPAPPIQIQAPVALSSRQFFDVGSALYLEHHYAQAIPPYQKAFDLEKEDPQLDRTLWRVLIDHLGMAYGMTGRLKEARAIFEQGIESDPTYPMFHYNLACTFAEMNDLNHAMQSLKTAFRYRKNQNPGETAIPDPRQDTSFQRFMKNATFKTTVESLIAGTSEQ